MLNSEMTSSEKKDVDFRLLVGAVNRAQTLSLVYMAVFAAYAFTSFAFIQEFDPRVTLFDNMWPRLLFNVLPFFVLHRFLKKSEASPDTKTWVWALGLPIIFLAACLVHVWGIIANGQGDIYLYVHSANTFILVTAIMVVAPPLKFIIAQTVGFALFVIAPVSYLFVSTHNQRLLQFSLGDYFIAIPVVILMGNMIHKLRYKIAFLDLQTKKQASSFLGSHIAEAIYENNVESLRSRRVNSVVLQIDIRSYTDFYNSSDVNLVRAFMRDYHGLISRKIGQTGGYWHKSIGDAHLATFGAMDPVPNYISDLPGIENSLEVAEENRKTYYFRKSFEAVQQIIEAFEELKLQHGITFPIRLGVGMAYGDLEVRIQGDELHKRELDIDGRAVILCARLEEYTKHLRIKLSLDTSVLVVSREIATTSVADGFTIWDTHESGAKIRNFPDEKFVHYMIFEPPVANTHFRLKVS